MENCLVTKLKGSVSNQNIEKLGVLQVVMAEQSGVRRMDISSDNSILTLVGDAVFTDNTGTADLGKTSTVSEGYTVQRYIKNITTGDVLEISNKYKISHWGANSSAELTASEFNYAEWLTNLSTLNFGNNHAGLNIDLDEITRYSPNITSIIILRDADCSGTIETIVENIFGSRTVVDNLVMAVYGAEIKLNNSSLTIASTSTNITIAFTSSGATVTLGSAQIAEYDKDNGWTYSN